MTPEALAALHTRCFAHTPRPWTAAEFAALLGQAAALVVTRPEGFALGRIAGPEAELLTLAVDPAARRQGVARALVAAFEAQAAARGGGVAFLEVAETNMAARALYAELDYREAGRRPGYFTRPDGPAIDALVLRKSLAGAIPRPHGKTI